MKKPSARSTRSMAGVQSFESDSEMSTPVDIQHRPIMEYDDSSQESVDFSLKLSEYSQNPILTTSGPSTNTEDQMIMDDLQQAAAITEWINYATEESLDPRDHEARAQFFHANHLNIRNNNKGLTQPLTNNLSLSSPMDTTDPSKDGEAGSGETAFTEVTHQRKKAHTQTTKDNSTDGKEEPKHRQPIQRPAIPPEALRNRYSADCINSTYDVLFQADPSQPDTKGLNEMKLALLVVKILEEEGIHSEATTGQKIGAAIMYSFNSKEQAHLMVNNAKLAHQKIIAYIPDWATERRGVIKGVNLDIEEDDIMKYIRSPSNVKSAKRLDRYERNEDNTMTTHPTRSILLTFDGQIIPQYITLLGLHCEMHPYTAPVKRCGNCLRFGHTRKHRRSPKTCTHCGKKAHEENEICPAAALPAKCINCKANHKSTVNNCPELKMQRETPKYAAANNISYKQARDTLNDGSPIQLPQTNLRHPPPTNNINFPPIHPKEKQILLLQKTFGVATSNPTTTAPNPTLHIRNPISSQQNSGHQNPQHPSYQANTAPHHRPQGQHQNRLAPSPPRQTPSPNNRVQNNLLNLHHQHQSILISPHGGSYTNLNQSLPSMQGNHPKDSREVSTIHTVLKLRKIFVKTILTHLTQPQTAWI